jgi:hypothetical protein
VPLVRRPILLIQSPLRQVKPSADRSSLPDRHRHWPPTQLHSHRHRRPHHRLVMLGCLSRIGPPPLSQIHVAAVLIWLPPPRSGRSCADPPPPKPQSAASTTTMSCYLSACRVSGCGPVLGSLHKAFNLVLLLCTLQIATTMLMVNSSSTLPPPQ